MAQHSAVLLRSVWLYSHSSRRFFVVRSSLRLVGTGQFSRKSPVPLRLRRALQQPLHCLRVRPSLAAPSGSPMATKIAVLLSKSLTLLLTVSCITMLPEIQEFFSVWPALSEGLKSFRLQLLHVLWPQRAVSIENIEMLWWEQSFKIRFRFLLPNIERKCEMVSKFLPRCKQR